MSYQSILYQLLLAVCSSTCVLPVLSIPRGSDEPNPIEHKDNTITVIIKSSVWINYRPVISPLYLVLRLQYRSFIISAVLCIDVLLSRRIYKYFLILYFLIVNYILPCTLYIRKINTFQELHVEVLVFYNVGSGDEIRVLSFGRK